MLRMHSTGTRLCWVAVAQELDAAAHGTCARTSGEAERGHVIPRKRVRSAWDQAVVGGR